MPRNSDEILRAFSTQGRHLMASCRLYDDGDKTEALRLATIVHTLVHDAGKNHSILSQLEIKHKMLFMASGQLADGARVGGANRYTPLIRFEKYRDRQRYRNNIPEFIPVSTYCRMHGINLLPRELLFEDWWENDVIFFDGTVMLTRKQRVFVLRNQEGGSHFDKEIFNPNYLSLHAPIVMVTPGYGFGLMDGLELATMRQVAEEVRLSVEIYHWLNAMRRRS
jgi:hypothetical protein